MKKPIRSCNEMCMTGWHVLTSHHELKEGFFGLDCDPLDAPERIPAGSSFKGKYSKTVLSTTVVRGEYYV